MIFFNEQITVKRPTLYSKTEEYFNVGTIMGIILPLKAEDVILAEGDPSKACKLYCDVNEDLKEADIVVDKDNVKYVVKAIRKFKFRKVSRLEAYIYKANN
ncbi:MAG: hypothetical protein EOL88_00545 [Bacteroidia bacterium]|nr:hypothetical protein [Bacteroidia bacterium]